MIILLNKSDNTETIFNLFALFPAVMQKATEKFRLPFRRGNQGNAH